MTALTGLSMSYNQTGAADSLMTLPAGLFDRLTKLTSLGLAHNDLKTLPAHIFQNLTALDSLALDGNPGSANFVPLAKAGPEGGLDAAAGMEVTLGADAPEGGPDDPWGTNVTYSWTQVSGETVDLSASDAARPTFTAPEPAEASELVFELAVAGRGATGSNAHRATRRLTVRVGAAPVAPVGPAVTDVSIVSIPQAGDTYRAGETIEVAVTFDGTVLVDTAGGTPTIQLSADTFEGLSDYARGSGTNRLVFAYTVKMADVDERRDRGAPEQAQAQRRHDRRERGARRGGAALAMAECGRPCRTRWTAARRRWIWPSGCAIARRRCATRWWRRSRRRATAPR